MLEFGAAKPSQVICLKAFQRVTFFFEELPSRQTCVENGALSAQGPILGCLRQHARPGPGGSWLHTRINHKSIKINEKSIG